MASYRINDILVLCKLRGEIAWADPEGWECLSMHGSLIQPLKEYDTFETMLPSTIFVSHWY